MIGWPHLDRPTTTLGNRMTKYVVKIPVETDNLNALFRLYSEAHELMQDIINEFDGVSDFDWVTVSEGEITNSDREQTEKIDQMINAHRSSGRNRNPLPEGMPEL